MPKCQICLELAVDDLDTIIDNQDRRWHIDCLRMALSEFDRYGLEMMRLFGLKFAKRGDRHEADIQRRPS